MKELIKEMKKVVSQMESYAYCDNYEKVKELTEYITSLTSEIQTYLQQGNNKETKSKTYYGLETISTIDFLYKPVMQRDYYEGDYLERFSEERTKQLKGANILELHDKFWTSNNVEKGNIFGSIPYDLIPKESADKLEAWGWKKTKVTVYEVEENITMRELDRTCSSFFKHYLIAMEMRNNSVIILEYDI